MVFGPTFLQVHLFQTYDLARERFSFSAAIEREWSLAMPPTQAQ